MDELALLIGWVIIGIPLALGLIGAIIEGCFGRGRPGKEARRIGR
jgi:hypothetical protein